MKEGSEKPGSDFKDDLSNSLRILQEGGVILYPTDTVWGLGCDATRSLGVEKIFGIKKRSGDQSLIVLVNGLTMLERYVEMIPETAYNILDVSDKPITLIYPGGKNLAAGICAGDGSVGIRITNDSFCKELITRLRKPLVSTSANISGKPAPANFPQIEEEILRSVDYIVRHRRDDLTKSTPSSVIKLGEDGTIKIIRE